MNNYAPPNAPITSSDDDNRRDKTVLKILAVLFALYGAYCLWFLIKGWYWSGGFSAAVSIASAIGLWLGKRWSKFPLYLFLAMICIYIASHIWFMVGYGWPFENKVQSFIALVPDAVILTLSIAAGMYVLHVFRKQS